MLVYSGVYNKLNKFKIMVETLYNETYNSDGIVIRREIQERTTHEDGSITIETISIEEY